MFPMNAAGLGLTNPFLAAQLAAAAQAAAINAQRAMMPQPGAALLGGVPLPAAPLRPSPMLVPPGMGIEGAASAPSPTSTKASNWTEHKHEDGRTFYYNKVTKQSVWSKPDELKLPSERSSSSGAVAGATVGSWKEYSTPEGKKYYYNMESKETTWTAPPGFDAPPAAAAAPGSAKEEKEEGKSGQSELERAMAATLASLTDNKTNHNVGSVSDVPMADPEAELKKRQADRFTQLLRDKYNDGKISSTCNWDKAVPFIQSDPRFRILNKVSEKKQLFNAWKVQRQKEERDEKRLAIKKAKEDLEEWLMAHPRMKSMHFRYQRAEQLFAKEDIWKSVNEDDRREIFRESQLAVHKKEMEEQKEKSERNVKRCSMQALSEILENMSEIMYNTTWAQGQRLLIENSDFNADHTLQSMDKMDALVVFERHIKHLEEQYEIEKKQDDMRTRRHERKTREAFNKLLKELHEKGELTSVSMWSTLYTRIASDPRFEDMLLQSGSTPLDLFKFYVEDLKLRYGKDRAIIKDILLSKKKDVTVNTTFDELVAWIHGDDKGKEVDMGNLKLCYNSLRDKAENKEKEAEREEARKKRRIESEFKNLLRTVQPAIEPETSWTVVRVKIEDEDAFKAMGSEKEREELFAAFAKGDDECAHHSKETKEKKKKDKKKKEKNHSDSEGDSSKKKKKKRRHDRDASSDEERDKKKKKKKSKRESSPASPRRRRSRSRSRSR